MPPHKISSVMHSYLAYITNRSFVFDDYIWSHGPFPYTVYDLEFRATRVPLNAFISGPIAGAPFFAPANSFPRAVHAKFWEAICPRERRHTILSADVPGDVWGTSRIQWWRDEIAKKENVFCLEVRQKPIFNFSFFGGPELLDIWPSLSQAPILTQLRWSPLISAAIERNFVILSDPHEHLRTIQANPDAAINELASASQAVLPVGMYPSLVAVHIRRGDFIRHCPRLASWGSPFHGFNSFKGLPDPWITSRDSSQLDTVEYYRKRCLPSQDEIVERLHAIRNEYDAFLSNQTNTTRFILDAQGSPTVAHKLRRVFILSNARILWLDGLKDKLVKDGWENVISRRDLVLDKQQRGVSVAVDMSVAEKAEMFVGNGFSSFSGNIVMLRTAKGFQTQTNRFF
ncbi:hypothetical protein Ac2012v2_006355 [Leucoagaricus gongylophorus]